MSLMALNKSLQGRPEPVANVNNVSPLLRIPGETRNRIYEHAFQADDDLVFHQGWRNFPSRFLPRGTSHRNSDSHFNELKFTYRQLYKETAGLEIRFNRVYFGSYCDHGGPAEQFLRFIGGCATGKQGWFRDVTLSLASVEGVVFSLDESIEPKHVMLTLAKFCCKYPEITIRYDVPSLLSGYVADGAIVQGLFLSLLFRGKDLRRVVATEDNSLLALVEAANWYKDTKDAATFRVSNLQFRFADKTLSVEFFKNNLPWLPWLRAEACLDVATDWLSNGI